VGSASVLSSSLPRGGQVAAVRRATWFNMINDQAAGLGGRVAAGIPRDSLYVLDVIYDRDSGQSPEMIVADTASDIDFALLTLAWLQERHLAPTQARNRERVTLHPGQGPRRGRIWGTEVLGRVERIPVQGGTQRPGRWPSPAPQLARAGHESCSTSPNPPVLSAAMPGTVSAVSQVPFVSSATKGWEFWTVLPL
jgi:hypothetical protein